MKKNMMKGVVGLILPALFMAFLVACGGGGGGGNGGGGTGGGGGDGPTYHL